MRFVPTNCLREGMLSAKKLTGANGEILLNYGATIHESYINRIKQLGYIGIYVEDDFSKDIEVIDIISDTLRFKAVKSVKNLFSTIENGKEKDFKQSSEEISALVNDILENVIANKNLMINMLDLKIFDDYTYFHSVNVGVLSILIGTSLSLNQKQLYSLGIGSILHDIGKVFIPKDIINLPRKLTEEEYEIVKSHSFKGYEYLKKNFDIPASAYIGVLEHHERFDGKGYPIDKSGTNISLFGRIICVADIYDALTSDRTYRKALSPTEAIEYLMSQNGKILDPQLLKVFLKMVSPYPVGTTITLSNGATAIVMENFPDFGLRPKIKVIKHANEDVEPYIINLKDDFSSYSIVITGISKDV